MWHINHRRAVERGFATAGVCNSFAKSPSCVFRELSGLHPFLCRMPPACQARSSHSKFASSRCVDGTSPESEVASAVCYTTLRTSQTTNTITMMVPSNPKPSFSFLLLYRHSSISFSGMRRTDCRPAEYSKAAYIQMPKRRALCS